MKRQTVKREFETTEVVITEEELLTIEAKVCANFVKEIKDAELGALLVPILADFSSRLINELFKPEN